MKKVVEMEARERERHFRRQARLGDARAKRWLDQQQHGKQAAEAFVAACMSGDEDALLRAVDELHLTVGGWPIAMKKAAALQTVSQKIQNCFLRVWTESKMLPSKVRPRPLVKALRVLLPRSSCPGPIRLFRGAAAGEHRQRAYGLCWSADRKTAERFADERRVWEGGSVVFETIAPPETVLFVREDFEGYFEESEYVVDPDRLSRVKVIARYSETEAAVN